METIELVELIKSRRSIRAWEDKPVPEEMLLQAVELATWAPNGANAQLWYFYIIIDKKLIKTIADTSQAGRDVMASWSEMAQFGGISSSSQPAAGGVCSSSAETDASW